MEFGYVILIALIATYVLTAALLYARTKGSEPESRK